MQRDYVLLGSYTFQLPDGTRGAHRTNDILLQDKSTVELPGERVYALQGYVFNGVLFMAGQGSDSVWSWLWRSDTRQWKHQVPCHGVRPCAFGAGALFVSTTAVDIARIDLMTGAVSHLTMPWSGQGIRYVTEAGIPVPGDATLFDGTVHEFTDRGVYRLGQGHEGGLLLGKMVGGVRDWRLVEQGDVQFPFFEAGGGRLGIACVKFKEGRSFWLTMAENEFSTLPSIEAPPPPPETPMYRDQNEVVPYLQRRWNELDVPARVNAVKQATGIFTDAQMTDLRHAAEAGDAAARAKHDDAEERFRAVQTPAFFQAVSELYWQQGMKDLGLGRKTGGANWQGMATDVLVLKPIGFSNEVINGQIFQVDAISGGGYPEARIGWSPIDFNPDRTWVEPPPVGDGPVDPPPSGATHRYDGGGHDTGECDICHKSRFDPIHAIPESKVKHTYDGGEQDTGLCDVCQKDADDPIHDMSEPEEPGEPIVEKHTFVPTKFNPNICAECGLPKTDAVHQVDVPPSTVDLTATNQLLTEIRDEMRGMRADLKKSTTSIVTALTALLPLLKKFTPTSTKGRK